MEVSLSDVYKILYNIDSQDEIENISITWRGYDENMLKQDVNVDHTYSIIRSCVHDGTLLFTHQLIASAFKLLLEGRSFDKRSPPKDGQLPYYTIGRIDLSEREEYTKPEHMTWPTMCEEITIPVKVEWR